MRNSLIFILLIFITLYASTLVIQEGQKGIILRFDKVLRDKNNNPLIYHPGLHLKIPFIEKIKILDARIQTMENQADRFVTMEKKDLIVDSYIKWKICDFSKYYLATGGGDISQAEILLKRKFSDRLRSELGKLDVKGIVTDSRNRLMVDVREALNNGTYGEENQDKIGIDQSEVLSDRDRKEGERVLFTNQNSMAALGIEVVDVRIKQINLPTEVSDAIYQRMRAEREAVARWHRSQGKEEAEKLRASADYKVECILAEAERQSLILRGEADSESARLYANSFGTDQEFYIFVRNLHAYEKSFEGKNNLMILSTNSHFFRFMKFFPKNFDQIRNG